MRFLNSWKPIIRRKQTQLDIQDLEGLIYWRWKINKNLEFSGLYTRIDQIFLIWGCITGLIFLIPHFFPIISWTYQAIAGSILSLIGIIVMAGFAGFWVKVEQLRWLVYLWSGLVVVGIGLTDYGIFTGSGLILMHLCSIWLTVCVIGYAAMGWGIQSRSFLIVAGLHALTVPLIQIVPNFQFLTTAAVMSGSLFLLAELQWDMRPPIASPVLSEAEQAFNRQQHELRQR